MPQPPITKKYVVVLEIDTIDLMSTYKAINDLGAMPFKVIAVQEKLQENKK
ncbi:MAG: hypothetical protein [Arizlama microvirus]|nr:MAG: hypothetical protein [Arizlama microvirus]